MASGFGFHGGEGRCYQFWRDVEDCTVSGSIVIGTLSSIQFNPILDTLSCRKKVN